MATKDYLNPVLILRALQAILAVITLGLFGSGKFPHLRSGAFDNKRHD